MPARRDYYVIHALKMGMSNRFDQGKRIECELYSRACNVFEACVRDKWNVGMFHYDKDGMQKRIRATEHYYLEKDAAPLAKMEDVK